MREIQSNGAQSASQIQSKHGHQKIAATKSSGIDSHADAVN
jgi:hypothetical protein